MERIEMEPGQTLSIVVAPEPEPRDDAKGLFHRPGPEPGIVKKIPVEQLQKELSALSDSIGEMLDNASSAEPGKLQLEELSVQVEITASGGINLIGSANVGATASMTLTFSRS
jgi:hypothetical protein